MAQRLEVHRWSLGHQRASEILAVRTLLYPFTLLVEPGPLHLYELCLQLAFDGVIG